MKNSSGSILSVAFVVIAILTFSLSSLSVYTIRTIENTDRTSQNAISRSEAQRYISQAINDFRKGPSEIEEYLDELEDIDDKVFDGLEILLKDNPDLFEEDELSDNLLPQLITTIKTIHNSSFEGEPLNIQHADDMWVDFDDEEYEGNVRALSFRFTFQHDDNRDVVQHLHVTNHGVEFEEFNAFLFAMGTNERFVMNGGNYFSVQDEDEDEDNVETAGRIFGGQVYENYQSFIYNNNTDGFEPNTAENLTNDSDYPTNYPTSQEGTFITPQYRRCDFDNEDFNHGEYLDGCMDTDEEGNIIMYTDRFDTVSGVDEPFLDDLFVGFDLQDHINSRFERAFDIEVTGETYIEHLNELSTPNVVTQGAIVSGDNKYDLQDNTMVEGNLIIDDSELSEIEIGENNLIVNGDLIIKNHNQELEIDGKGRIFVTGDLIFENTRNIETNASLFVQGDVRMNFQEDQGLVTPSFRDGVTLFSMGNIEVLYSNTVTSIGGGNRRSGMFYFAHGSILLNADSVAYRSGGAVYAQAQGDGLDRVQIENADSERSNFQGIFINSLNTDDNIPSDNYLDDYLDNPAEGQDQLGEGDIINPGSSDIFGFESIGRGESHYFDVMPIGEDGPPGQQDNLRDSFDNLPRNFNTLVLYPERYSYQLSTFTYRTREPE